MGTWGLRIRTIHDAKFHQNLFIHYMYQKSKGRFFRQLVQRWEKWSQSWKACPGGQAEIKNVTWCRIYIFNFSSAIRGHFSNVSSLFTSMDPLSKKKRPSDFWKTAYSAFTNFTECFFANIFVTVCHSHMGFSPLTLESNLRLLIFLHLKTFSVTLTFDFANFFEL